MINADVEGMKQHAEAMNVGHVFGLFACMLTARSWKALQAGIGKHEFTEAEVGVVFFLFFFSFFFFFIYCIISFIYIINIIRLTVWLTGLKAPTN